VGNTLRTSGGLFVKIVFLIITLQTEGEEEWKKGH